jgi:hypothetical protein
LNFSRPGKLYLTNLDGSNPVLLSPDFVHHDSLSTSWFPGTDLIAFLGTDIEMAQILVIHADGTGLSRITQSPYGVVNFQPQLIHGEIYWLEAEMWYGGWLLHGWRRTGIDGTGTTTSYITFDLRASPDGEFVAHTNVNYPGVLAISSTDGSSTVIVSVADLVDNPSDFYPVEVRNFLWFPDSQRVLVEVALDNDRIYRHLIISTSGELLGEVNMQQVILGDASWSPDGRLLIFLSHGAGGNYSAVVPTMLNAETMQAQDLEPAFFNINHAYRVLWLPPQ